MAFFFIFIIFILLRLECIKYIKYGTSSMLILDKKRDKIVDYWILHATSELGLYVKLMGREGGAYYNTLKYFSNYQNL